MSDVVFGIKLTADGTEVVGAAKDSSDAFDKLGTSVKGAQSEVEKLNTAQTTLAETLNSASQNAEEFNGQSNRLVDEYKQLTSSSGAWAAAQQKTMEELARSEAAIARNAAATADYKAKTAEAALANSSSSAEITKLLDRYDTQGAKLRMLTSDYNKLTAAADSGGVGGKDEARLALAYSTLQKEMTAAGGAATELGKEGAAGFEKIAESADKGAFATAGAKRELIVLGHEIITGNFSRVPGSLMVLAERIGLSGAALTGVLLPLAAVGGAAYALASAFAKGRAEMDAMNNALAVTNNYSGMTRGSMEQLAASMSQSGQVTIGVSKDIVTALVASGRIGSSSIETIAKLTNDFARSTGADISSIAPEMVKMFSDPIKGAEELNQSMHFLTATDLEHITTLQQLGEVQSAQLFLAQKLTDHMPKEEANVGFLTKAYRGLRDVMSDMANSAMSIGKTDTYEQQAKTKLEEINNLRKYGVSDDSEKIKMRVREYNSIMDLYVAEQKRGLASKEAGDAIDKETARQKIAVQYSKTAQIAAINNTIDQLKVGKQTTEILEAEKTLREQIASIQKPKAAAHIASDPINTAYINALKEANSLRDTAIGKTEALTQAQAALLKIEDLIVNVKGHQVKLWDVLNPAKKLEIEQSFVATSAVEKETAAHLAEQKARDDAIKTMDSETASIDKQTANTILQTQEIGKTKQQIDLIKAARYDHTTAIEAERLATIDATGVCTAESEALRENIKARNDNKAAMTDQAAVQATQDAIDLEKKANVDMWHTIESTAHSTWTNVFQGGSNAFKKIGETLKASVLDLLYQITIKQWFVGITASVTSGAASAAGSALGSAAGSSSGGMGVGSWISAGKSIYDAVSMSGAEITAAAAKMGQTAGYWAGQFTGASQATAESMVSAGNAIGTAASYIGPGLAGIAVGSMIAGDKKVVGLDGTTISAIGATIGGVVWGPVGAFIGGVAGGVLDAAFGMGAKQSGTTTLNGNFSQQGFAGQYQTPWTQDGGWFRSDKSGVDVQGVGATQQAALSAVVGGTKSVFDALITASGDAQKSLTGWTFAINRQVSTQEQQNQLVIDMANSMGSFLIPSLSALQKTGENLADTAVRLKDEFLATNSVAQLLGQSVTTAFGQVGIASLAARDNLVTLMGGLTGMNTTMQAYYTNFFTASERHANDLGNLTLQFAALGFTIPTTADGFKALVSAQDLTTASGQQTFASLMSISSAFASVVGTADQAVAATQAAVQAQQQADAAIATERQGLQTQLDNLTLTSAQLLDKQRSALDASNRALFDNIQAVTAQQAATAAAQANIVTLQAAAVTAQQAATSGADALRAFGVSVHDLQASLLAGVQSPAGVTASGAQAAFSATNAAAAAGDVTAQGALAGAATAFLDAAKLQSKSALDYARSFAFVQNSLSDTATKTDITVSAADKQLSAVQQTNTLLGALNTTTTKQSTDISSLLVAAIASSNAAKDAVITQSISDATKSIASAVAAYGGSFNASKVVSTVDQTGATNLSYADMYRNTSASVSGSGSVTAANTTTDAASKARFDAKNAAFQRLIMMGSAGQYGGFLGTGAWNPAFTPAQIAAQSAIFTALPAFAAGGEHIGGLRIVGENGPELEATGPSRIFTANQTKNMLSGGGNNDAMVAELQALRAEVASLRKSSSDTAVTNKKIADLLLRVTRDGDSLVTVPA